MRVPIDIQDAIKYYKAVCFGTVQMKTSQQ
jgi:hypothetical protein